MSCCPGPSPSRTRAGSGPPRSLPGPPRRAVLDDRGTAIAANNLALILAERGEYDRALDRADLAVELYVSAGGRCWDR